MAEVYVYSGDSVKTKIFTFNDIVDADGQVLVDVYDITQDPGLVTPIDPTVPVLQNYLAIKTETDTGSYEFVIPETLTARNRKLKLVWKYSVYSTAKSHTSFCDVVTPYCNLAEAIEDLGLGTDSSDPNYKTYHQLRMAEKYARKVIETYCGQQFSLYDDVQVAYGAGTNILALPFKLSVLHELYADDVLLLDNVNNINNWNYNVLISETGFGIRIDEANMLDNTVYVANGMIPPTINDLGSHGAFRKDVRYRVQGKFGWDDVPDSVEEACITLMGDYFAKDSVWKNKYVNRIQSFDAQFEYFDDVFRGTGNLYVDQLLQPYVVSGMIVI